MVSVLNFMTINKRHKYVRIKDINDNKSIFTSLLQIFVLSGLLFSLCFFTIHFYKQDTNPVFLANQNTFYHRDFPAITVSHNFIEGWNHIKVRYDVTKDNEKNNNKQFYYGGYVEGYLLNKQLDQHLHNIFTNRPELFNDKLEDYINKNINHIRTNNKTTEYIHANYYLTYLEGYLDGYNSVHPNQITFNQLLSINYIDDAEDIMTTNMTRCTSIIKLVDNKLLITHTTWFDYFTAIRVFRDIQLPNLNITYSSYPGIISSSDDYYINSHGLTVMETSYYIFNNSLFNYIDPYQIPTWLHSVVASHLSKTPKEWCRIFSKEITGLTNAQWTITQNTEMWVIETLPNHIYHYQNMTDYLLKYKYWLGYNYPYFLLSFNTPNYNDSRPNIMFELNHTITDIYSLKKAITYNKYSINTTYDAYIDALSSRGDLSSHVEYPRGSIDVKITTSDMVSKRLSYIYSGYPKGSDDSITPFNWKDWSYISHDGIPDIMDNKWIWI